jgi:hypothetical protein
VRLGENLSPLIPSFLLRHRTQETVISSPLPPDSRSFLKYVTHRCCSYFSRCYTSTLCDFCSYCEEKENLILSSAFLVSQPFFCCFIESQSESKAMHGREFIPIPRVAAFCVCAEMLSSGSSGSPGKGIVSLSFSLFAFQLPRSACQRQRRHQRME